MTCSTRFQQARAEEQAGYEAGLSSLRSDTKISQEEKTRWNGLPKAERTARAFRAAHRDEVDAMFLSYPSIDRGGIRIHKGLERGELPFQKEFLMARLLKDILTAEGRKVTGMALLPRYTGRMLSDVFSVDVAHSSTEDALAVSLEDGEEAETTEYFEFKMGSGKNLGSLINNALSAGTGRSLIVVDRLPRNIDGLARNLIPIEWDHDSYVFDMSDGSVRGIHIGGKKQNGLLNPHHSSQIEIQGGAESATPSLRTRYYEAGVPSSLDISYLDELRTVDRDAILDYGQYLRDTGYVYSSEKSRRETEEFLMRQEAEAAAYPERTRAEAVREGLSAIEGEELSRAAAVHEEAMSDDTPLSPGRDVR